MIERVCRVCGERSGQHIRRAWNRQYLTEAPEVSTVVGNAGPGTLELNHLPRVESFSTMGVKSGVS